MTTTTTTSRSSQPAPDVDALRAAIQGTVIVPGDAAYDTARRIKNFVHDPRPAAIVRAGGDTDVAEAVRFARANGIQIAGRSGGHSFGGYSSVDDSLVIDLSAMRHVEIDPVASVARVQAGATSEDIARPAHAYGLAMSTGDTGSVGIGGLATGGGIGFMVRKRGLTIDNMLSATIVTAEGEIVRASTEENQDLFWGVRGGGGNFGVATSFEFQLAPDGAIYGGAIMLPPTVEVVRGYLEYASQAPDELTTIAHLMYVPPAPFVPEEKIGAPAFVILVCYTGDPDEGARVVQPLRELAEPIAEGIGQAPYPTMFMFTEVLSNGFGDYSRSMFTNEIPDDAIAAMVEHQPTGRAPFSMIQIRPLGGAMARVPADASAFPHRDKKFLIAIIGAWLDPAEDPQPYHDWTMDLWERVKHLREGTYVNFLHREGDERIAEAYTTNQARLTELKAKWDPDNVFNLNQNIKPA